MSSESFEAPELLAKKAITLRRPDKIQLRTSMCLLAQDIGEVMIVYMYNQLCTNAAVGDLHAKRPAHLMQAGQARTSNRRAGPITNFDPRTSAALHGGYTYGTVVV